MLLHELLKMLLRLSTVVIEPNNVVELTRPVNMPSE